MLEVSLWRKEEKHLLKMAGSWPPVRHEQVLRLSAARRRRLRVDGYWG